MKNRILWSVLVIMGCLATGCSRQEPQQYISKRGEYVLEYPAGWRVMDDERRLTGMRQNINRAGQAPMSFEFNPDAVFVGAEDLGALVVVSPLPLLASGTTLDDEEALLEGFRAGMSALGASPAESVSRDIHGKAFKIDVVAAAQNAVSLSGLCLHNHHIYMFQWSCAEAKFSKWRPVFERCLDSVSFVEADIKSAQQTQDSDRAGFFTGLWHGLLLPFRALASIIWKIDVYADHATRFYLVGFIVGSLWWGSSLLGVVRRK